METITLIDRVLSQCGEELINTYRSKLSEYGKNASGLLGNSLNCFVRADGTLYELYLSIQDYWKYIEYGRDPGKFPPLDAIKRWIQIKPVLPNPVNGKLPTIDQLSFLIGRKIEREGIESTPILSETLDTVSENLDSQLSERVDDAIEIIFNEF